MSTWRSVVGEGLSATAVLGIVRGYAEEAGLRLSPHDLHRTCAKLCRLSGDALEYPHLAGMTATSSSHPIPILMRENAYVSGVLLGAGLLLYLGRDLLTRSALLTWGLSFAGTTAVGILAMALYRVLAELRASRHELARKEAELNFALEVQQALFPRQFPEGGLEFAAACLPARGISGDYYDVLPLSDGRVAFALADISGKGISAAILMSNLHAVLRTLARTACMPGQLCSQLNRHLYEVTQPAAKFATLFYGEWNGADRQLSYVNAGHPLPILLGSGRGRRLDRGGPPLGLFLDSEYQVGKVPLQPGDTIVVYSDGVTEAETPKGESFGEARLEALVAAHCDKPLPEIQRVVLVAARDWSGKEIVDDMTLLLARVTGPGRDVQ